MAFCLGFSTLHGQSIKDKETAVHFQYTNDTISVEKSNVGGVVVWGDSVSLVPIGVPITRNAGPRHALLIVDPSTFGYSSKYILRQDLETMFNEDYQMIYSYDANDIMDTAIYLNPRTGTDTLRYEAFGNDGTNITTSTGTKHVD